MSTAFHPETDGASERTNKTLNQCLRFYVDRTQKGWVKALPSIRFTMMNTKNASTGLSGFQLRLGCSPRVIPPLVTAEPEPSTEKPEELLRRIQLYEMEARDSLLQHKVTQAFHANKGRDTRPSPFKVGMRVKLSTENRRKQFKAEGKQRASKLMPRFEGPYIVRELDEAHSTVTLEIPRRGHPRGLETFHTSLVRPWVEDEANWFDKPTRPALDANGEAIIECILDRRKVGRGYSYLVKWEGFPNEENEWLPGRFLEDCEALDRFFEERGIDKAGNEISGNKSREGQK